jgi:ParB-like chromosome segregation protein Spo0J/16S rRNA G966 N2-methylase RsmD
MNQIPFGKAAEIAISELLPAQYNPRKISKEQMRRLIESIEKNGFAEPIIVNDNPERKNVVIGGHQRLKALKKIGLPDKTKVPVYLVDLDEANEKKLNIALNNISGDFEIKKLATLFKEFCEKNIDAAGSGFDEEEIRALAGKSADALEKYKEGKEEHLGNLAKRYLLPPFSVLDTRAAEWQNRKAIWKERIRNLGATREGKLGALDNLIGAVNSGISIFDPVLSELIYKWFLTPDGNILDPFAGDAARSLVAAFNGTHYTGIDIREDQIEENKKTFERWNLSENANFIVGNSEKLDDLLPENEKYDLVFTCPPYYDLEVYSDIEGDASNKQTYEEFMEFYKKVFTQCVKRLKKNRFLVCVVGEIRDDKGVNRGFVKDNIQLFQDLGLQFYNEIILLESIGTARIRANNQMRKNRKLVKVHQNILVFFNGDPVITRNALVFFNGDPETIKQDYPDLATDIEE